MNKGRCRHSICEEARNEVAREIFEELEEYFTKPKGVWFWQMDLAKIAELKKKYIPQEPMTQKIDSDTANNDL